MNELHKLKRRIQYVSIPRRYPDVIRHKWIVQKCYEDMFRAAGGDFNELVANATLNERGEKEIPFMDYELTEEEFYSILDFYVSFLKNDYYNKQLSVQIHLGCSPKIKK